MPDDRKPPALTWRPGEKHDGADFLLIGSLYVGQVSTVTGRTSTHYRAYIMLPTVSSGHTLFGKIIGMYQTPEAARAALYAAVCKELGYAG